MEIVVRSAIQLGRRTSRNTMLSTAFGFPSESSFTANLILSGLPTRLTAT